MKGIDTHKWIIAPTPKIQHLRPLLQSDQPHLASGDLLKRVGSKTQPSGVSCISHASAIEMNDKVNRYNSRCNMYYCHGVVQEDKEGEYR